MRQNAWEDIANWKKVEQINLTTINSKKEELEMVGELSKVWSQVVLKCVYLARIGRPDVLWSVNKLARSVTKWKRACDQRLARLTSYIHNTSDHRQCCY